MLTCCRIQSCLAPRSTQKGNCPNRSCLQRHPERSSAAVCFIKFVLNYRAGMASFVLLCIYSFHTMIPDPTNEKGTWQRSSSTQKNLLNGCLAEPLPLSHMLIIRPQRHFQSTLQRLQHLLSLFLKFHHS
jgi:hypothetical protein